MPRRVALASCDPIHPLGLAEADRVAAALAEEGIDARRAVWTDASVDWAAFDAVVIRSTWDYPERLPAFEAWMARVSAATRMWNSERFVRWNLHKGYLLELARAGIAIPPSRLVRRDSRADLAELLGEMGWTRAVVKPAVGVTGIGIARADAADPAPAQAHLEKLLAQGDAIVQAYLPSIESQGETSMFFFGGEYSHAIRKRPASGDYRVQLMWGGSSAPAQASEDELALARRVLKAAPEDLLYARVDTVRLEDGSPALMELEAIEPYLFLEDAPDAVSRYAKAIAARF